MKAIQILRIINFIWRARYMYKGTMKFVSGIGAGMLAGVAVATVGSKMMKGKNKHFKRNAGKALHTVGDLIDNVQYMFK